MLTKEGFPFSLAASAHTQAQRDSGFASAAILNLFPGIHREASPTLGRKQLKFSETYSIRYSIFPRAFTENSHFGLAPS